MRAAKVQASLRIRAVSTEPSLLAHTSSESRGTFRQKARSLAPLNGWACAVKVCHDGMLEDTNSLGGAQIQLIALIEPDNMYSAAAIGVITIFIPLVVLCRPVIYDIREITVMRFKFIPCDTDEWSFETLFMILLIDLQVHYSQQTGNWPLLSSCNVWLRIL